MPRSWEVRYVGNVDACVRMAMAKSRSIEAREALCAHTEKIAMDATYTVGCGRARTATAVLTRVITPVGTRGTSAARKVVRRACTGMFGAAVTAPDRRGNAQGASKFMAVWG